MLDPVKVGLNQWYVQSLLLFTVAMDVVFNETIITCYVYVDDLVLMVSTTDQLITEWSYYLGKGLKVNATISKVIPCSSGGNFTVNYG